MTSFLYSYVAPMVQSYALPFMEDYALPLAKVCVEAYENPYGLVSAMAPVSAPAPPEDIELADLTLDHVENGHMTCDIIERFEAPPPEGEEDDDFVIIGEAEGRTWG